MRVDPPEDDRKSERNVNKIKRWALLSAAGVIAIFLGARAQEAVVLDHDTLARR